MLNFLSQIGNKRKQQKQYQPQGEDQKDPVVKNPRSIRHKFIKQLNYKKSLLQKSEKSREYLKKFYQNQNSRKILLKNTRNSSQEDINSLLENVVPGAKIISAQSKDHRLNGYVQLEYTNGSTFKGIYENGMRTSGFMIYFQANCQYTGQYFGDRFSGFGKLSYYQGRSIEGQWQQSRIVGNATITYPNNDVYYGPVDDKFYKEGQGYLFLNNGNKYIGMFKAGSLSGVGTYYQKDVPIAKGLWQKGKLVKQMNLQDNLSQFSSIQNLTIEQFQRSKNRVPSISQMLNQKDWQYQPINKKQLLKNTNQRRRHRKQDSQSGLNKKDSRDQINQSSI